ncbi:MAG: hypothetical protein K6F58_03705 [Bacteroidales bacterium]|nr:hypothetical protein [Bacteroidales bacterium]
MQLTEEIRTILEYSRDEAMRTGCHAIAPEHLLLGILRHRSSSAIDFLTRAGLDPDTVKTEVDARVFQEKEVPYGEQDSINFTRSALNVCSMAVMEAVREGGDIRAVHLLAALCDTPGDWCGEYLRSHGLDIRIIRAYTKKSSAEPSRSALPSAEELDRLIGAFYSEREIYS